MASSVGAEELQFANVIGDENPLFDLMVWGVDLLTANGDLTVDNELHLEVINEITTANITAAGLAKISLGTIGEDTFSSTGNVTLGNVETLSLEVSNNGSFTAGDLTTSDGGINVISLNELVVGQLTATNGVVDLVSGNAGINVGGTIVGDLGFIATALLDITTNEITSSQDVALLKSSQGAVSVNGSISAYKAVSLFSANDVAVDTITSEDAGVSLISANGIIKNNGTISNMEDVTLVSAQDIVITKNVNTKLGGGITLYSTQGSVVTKVGLKNNFNLDIIAKNNVTTQGIRSYGNVIIDAELGKANIRQNINSGGGDISISGYSKVITRNITSQGGDVSVISATDSIITGYVKTDSSDGEGNVYLNAQNDIKVASSTNINGIDYSIYTGENGIINAAYQKVRRRAINTNNFNIGSITSSGTQAEIYGEYAYNDGQGKNPVIEFLKLIFGGLIEGSRNTPSAPPVSLPTHFNQINPLTSEPYIDNSERELTEKLSLGQKIVIRRLLTKTDKKDELLKKEEFRRGQVDDDRDCFSTELNIHKGDTSEYPNHGLYAQGNRIKRIERKMGK